MKEKTRKLKIKIGENFQKNRISVIFLLLLWILAICFTLYHYRDSLGKISSGNEVSDQVVELCDETVIEEILPINEESESIALKLATYARKNNGSFHISIRGAQSNKVYNEENIRASSLQDNAFKTFRLCEKLDSDVDRQIVVTLTSESPQGQGAGIYYSSIKAYEGSVFKINDETMDGDLSLRFLNENESLSLFYHMIIIWVISTFSLIILMLLLVKPKYETLFTMMAICFGLTFWLIITPMSVPDETIHYEYSLQQAH